MLSSWAKSIVAEVHTKPTLPYRRAQTETYTITWRVSILSIRNGKQRGARSVETRFKSGAEENGKSITNLYREFGLPRTIEHVPAHDGEARSVTMGRVS